MEIDIDIKQNDKTIHIHGKGLLFFLFIKLSLSDLPDSRIIDYTKTLLNKKFLPIMIIHKKYEIVKHDLEVENNVSQNESETKTKDSK